MRSIVLRFQRATGALGWRRSGADSPEPLRSVNALSNSGGGGVPAAVSDRWGSPQATEVGSGAEAPWKARKARLRRSGAGPVGSPQATEVGSGAEAPDLLS
jgi:hypothetical protein